MKKILLLAGIVNNQATATGNITNKVYDLLSKNYDVDVLYIATQPSHLKNIPANYYPISDPLMKFIYCKKGNKRNIVFIFVKVFRKIKSLFDKSVYIKWYYHLAYNLMEEKIINQKIDLIISFSSPFIAHITAKDFSFYHNLPWIAITIDPLYHSRQFSNRKMDLYEKAIYEAADFNLFTEDLIQTKINKYFRNEIHYAEFHYEIKDNTSKNEISSSKRINLLYQGTFYKKIREPHYMLKVLSGLPKDFHTNIYSQGKYVQTVKKYTKKYGNMKYNPFVSKDEISKVLKQSNIFINISNSIADFTPSKLYEYMSYGKPIINFYKNGRYSKILSSYPYALQINEDTTNIDDSIKQVIEFCLVCGNKNANYETLQKFFPKNTPEYNEKVILDLIRVFTNTIERK